MDLIIHAYGYSELIFHVLQGIAMFRESSFYTTIINTMVLLVGIFYALQMTTVKADGQWRAYLLKCLGMVVFVNSLLLPKASMLIKDHVEKSIYKVDNIPLAFALPVGAVENFGHLLTMGFEQVFSLVGSRSSQMYYHYGTVFGARLTKEVMEARIRDPEVVSNMRNFIDRCVVLPAMIGRKFSKEELFASSDIWGLVSKNAGVLTRTDMVINRARVTPSPTCKEATGYFEAKFKEQEQRIITEFSKKFRGAGNSLEYNSGARQLNSNMAGAITALYGGEHRVDTILKNNMMINAINDYRSGKYAGARAQMQQEAGGLLSGDLAEKTLTGSLAVMKVVVYGSFIFLFPLLIVSGGIAKYKGWIIMAFSLSLWPPLFSILNMIIDFAYEPSKIVSYSSWSTEYKKFDSIASTAASLAISIPFLSYWIIRMGEGGFTHLAGTIMATANAATGGVAAEKAVGSRNWDNESIGNYSRDNSNIGKTNHNLEYVSGENSYNTADGSHVKLTAGGKEVIGGGAGITSDVGESHFSLESAQRGEVNLGAEKSMQKLESDTRSLSEAKSNTYAQSKDFLKSVVERETAGKNVNYEAMGEQGESVRQMASTAKTLAKDYGYNWDQATEGAVEGRIDATPPLLKKFTGVSIDGSGRIVARNSSRQDFSEKEAQEQQRASEANYNNLVKAAVSHSHSADQSVDRNASESVKSAYEEQQRLETTVAKSRQEAESWHEAQNIVNSSGSSESRDMTGELIDKYMQASGINDRQRAYKDVMEHKPAAMRVWNKIKSEDGYVRNLVSDISDSKQSLSKENTTSELNSFSDSNELVKGRYDSSVARAGLDSGFSEQKIEQNIGNQKQSLDNKYAHLRGENTQVKADNDYDLSLRNDATQNQINQYEQDRIGQGMVASGAGAVLDYIGAGKIGGPTKDELVTTHVGKPTYTNAAENKAHAVSRQTEDDLADILPDWKPYQEGEMKFNHLKTDKEKVER
jgi:hypothetical protein